MPTQGPMDPLESLLRRSPLTNGQRARLWDAYESSRDPDELAAALQALEAPKQIKASLWDLKAGATSAPMDSQASGDGSPAPQVERPVGMHAALAGATGISETPLYKRGIFGGGRGPSVDDMLGTLPAVGGAVGGVLGGRVGPAGALKGSALGGAAGEALRQHGRRLVGASAPMSGTEAATDIAKEAAIQAAAEGGGRLLAAGGKTLGRGMVENAVRPPIGLQREFPDVIDTIVRERLPVGAAPFGTVKGSERAARRLAEESASVKALLAKAAAGGKSFETSKLAEPVLSLLDDVADQPLSKADMASLERMFDEFTAKKGPLSPGDVQKIKQKAQAIARPIYKAQARGEAVTADQAISARFNDAIAKGAKGAMEEIPGVAEGEARKRSLIGAKKALSQAEMRRLSLMAEGITGASGIVAALTSGNGGIDETLRNGVLAYAATRWAMSPRIISRAGLQLTREQTQELLRQFPRLAQAVVSVAREEEAQQSTGSR